MKGKRRKKTAEQQLGKEGRGGVGEQGNMLNDIKQTTKLHLYHDYVTM